MDAKCGELFEEATRYNQTLIDFEFSFNNFNLDDVGIGGGDCVGEEDPGQPEGEQGEVRRGAAAGVAGAEADARRGHAAEEPLLGRAGQVGARTHGGGS